MFCTRQDTLSCSRRYSVASFQASVALAILVLRVVLFHQSDSPCSPHHDMAMSHVPISAKFSERVAVDPNQFVVNT